MLIDVDRDGLKDFVDTDLIGAVGEVPFHLHDGDCIPENGGTRVVESFDAEAQNPVDMQRSGWQAILDRFKAYTEAHA